MITGSNERPTEVTHSESEPDVAEVDPVQDPPYVTRTGRTSKPPQRLISDPVWSQKASVLLSLANSQNQELLQNVFSELAKLLKLCLRSHLFFCHAVSFGLLTNVGTTFP